MTARTRSARLMRVRDGVAGWAVDRLAVEEPLEVRVDGTALTLTMRTPGDDFDLVVGLLFAEGLIDGAEQVREIRTCADPENANVLEVALAPAAPGAGGILPRRLTTTSACGVCGAESLAAVRAWLRWEVASDPLRMTSALLARLPEELRGAQRAFEVTGGLHAAALFDATGGLVCLREDVGRHNAFDKVIGWALTRRLVPLRSHIIVASGRASFELIQKALAAGIPCLAAISAPSSLAVDLAAANGMTLVGFLRGGRMNVYSGQARVALGRPAAETV